MPVSGYSAATQGSIGLGYAVPAGWGANWRAARNAAGTTRTEVPIFGDSTTLGSGALYSWVQRLRDRSVAAGYADGGKGIFGTSEGTMSYDAPEINGFVSKTGFDWGQDAALTDILIGESYTSSVANDVLTVQGKIVGSGGALRLWYTNRSGGGAFTWALDGGTATTVNPGADQSPGFVYVTGLAAGTHTLVITNTSGGLLITAPCFMNGTGVVYQKFGRSGGLMNHYFDPLGRYSGAPSGRERYAQGALGLVQHTGDNLAWQQALSATTGRPSCSLAILHLGFNDLGNIPKPWAASASYTTTTRVTYGGICYQALANNSNVAPPSDGTKWAVSDIGNTGQNDIDSYSEGIHLFCRLAQAAGADPVVISGEYLMQSLGGYQFGGRLTTATRETALACGAAWCDFMVPALGKPNAITGQASTNNPHLNKPGYVAQADFLWNNVLSL